MSTGWAITSRSLRSPVFDIRDTALPCFLFDGGDLRENLRGRLIVARCCVPESPVKVVSAGLQRAACTCPCGIDRYLDKLSVEEKGQARVAMFDWRLVCSPLSDPCHG